MTEQAFIERWQKEITDRDDLIRKLTSERDLYAAQAHMNKQTVIRQQHEIRRLEAFVARLMETNDE